MLVTELNFIELEKYVACLSRDQVESHNISPGWQSLPTPPLFILGALPEAMGRYFCDRPIIPAINYYVFRNARVTADGIILHDGNALFTWATNHPSHHVQRIAEILHPGELPSRRVSGSEVLFSGPGYTVYGHWLIDILPRLEVLRRQGLDVHRLRYLVPTQIPAFAIELLACFGIRADQLVTYDETNETVEPDELIVPTNLRYEDRCHPWLSDARAYLLNLFRPGDEDVFTPRRTKIFISRQDIFRNLSNRQHIEQTAQDLGYSIVRPETYSINSQIKMFQQAELLAGEYGSALHGSLFSPAGTQVFVLRSTSRYPGLNQSGMCEALNQPIGYALGNTEFGAMEQTFFVSDELFRLGHRCLELNSGLISSNRELLQD